MPGARAIPCWKIPAKALIRHHHSSLEPGKSTLVTQRREEKFRFLCPPTGFLAPLNLHNSPSAVPWGQWDPGSSRAPCGSRGFLRSAPALALAHANSCTNGSLPCTWGLASARPWSPARAGPHPKCRGDCKPSQSALCCMAAQSRCRQQSGE